MEDAVAIHPFLCIQHGEIYGGFHYFAVYDGHGCSHVDLNLQHSRYFSLVLSKKSIGQLLVLLMFFALLLQVGEWCRERLHELVREEITSMPERTGCGPVEWRDVMRRSFTRMDSEVNSWKEVITGAAREGSDFSCKCEMQSPECESVGSTAVVAIVTPDKIIVANCGDSRAVLCRKGKAIPLSVDHKPDRPDELERIHAAGGSVIYWNGARLLGVLAMSRAIGDIFLKPYVSCEPERRALGCGVEPDCMQGGRMCLRKITSPPQAEDGVILLGQMVGCGGCDSGGSGGGGTASDDACSDASMLLTKLAIARHSTDNVSVVVVDLR
ncbi:hypothetical protein SAY86_032168 [Trapa natans]|uniref:protein-serine/threonine phosphatase n=1 Tax=Trapa natans TaxID=22666 RepID=A0AAN7M8Q2_TRANT|nr:hypothetical protein SAY86_032168 [Trapa natans]